MADLLSDITSMDDVPSNATILPSSSISSQQGQQDANDVNVGQTGSIGQSHGLHMSHAGHPQQQTANNQHADPLALPPHVSELLQRVSPGHAQSPQHGQYQPQLSQSASQSSQLSQYQSQSQPARHRQYQPQLSHSDSTLPSRKHTQSQLFPAAPAWSQGQPQTASQPQSLGSPGFTHSLPETLNVNIVTPAIWTNFDAAHQERQPAAIQQAQSTFDVSSYASAPPLPVDTEQPHALSFHSSSAPLATHQYWPQSHAQTETQAGLPPLAAAAGGDNKRSIGTNTQLRMQRSSPAQRVSQPASGLTDQQAESPQRDGLSRPGSVTPSPDRNNNAQAEASQSSVLSPGTSQAPTVRHSESVGSLSSLGSMEGLDKRMGGQMPMRAGSPALGGGGSSRPPAWSAAKHDPFGDLVSHDLRSSSSRSIDGTNLPGPTS